MLPVTIEHLVINPICKLRAPPSSTRMGVLARIGHIVQSQVITRIIAISTPLFAVLDLYTLVVMETALGTASVFSFVYEVVMWEGFTQTKVLCREVYQTFQTISHTLRLACIGPTIGVINPDIFDDYRTFFQPTFQPNFRPVAGSPTPLVQTYTPVYRQIAAEDPPAMDNLSKEALLTELNEAQNLDALEVIWRRIDLKTNWQGKCVFIDFISEKEGLQASARERFASRAYRAINHNSIHPSPPRWLSTAQIVTQVSGQLNLGRNFNPLFCQAFYYHATGYEENFQSILKGRKICVRHNGAFKGAFVSTKPETSYGPYIFALRRKIEQGNEIVNGFAPNSSSNAYWAGFAYNIPVTEETLAYVIVNLHFIHPRQTLEQIENKCLEWTKRNICVISLQEVEPYLQKIVNLNMGIPREWPVHRIAS